MLSEREHSACSDIIANVEKGRRFTRGMTYETFAADERTVYAGVRCLEIKSEASRRLTAETKERHPHVPWRVVANAGNAYRHGYHRVELDMMWFTLTERLDELVAVCRIEVASTPP
nr:DUF86 domain-containing protein [Methylobacterium sp. OTU13CASTA1]